MRARERVGLFDMVKNAASDARPHPEERACEKRHANANLRARVWKDEDEQSSSPSCFETHRSAPRPSKNLRTRRAAMLLSMRARVRGEFWPNEPNPPRSSEARPGRRRLVTRGANLRAQNDERRTPSDSRLFLTEKPCNSSVPRHARREALSIHPSRICSSVPLDR
jgi:hypothetical protein